MKSSELLSLLESVGPLSISHEFCKTCNFYDNSGILIDSGEDIKGVLFSLDLCESAINEAVKHGFNAIVTHHPAIFGAISSVLAEVPKTSLVARCLRLGITVISMHLNFDAAPEGIDYHLMKGLGGESGKTMINLTGGAYGRVYPVAPTNLSEFVTCIKKNFSTDRVVYYGEDEKRIARVASFCGAGCDDGAIEFAVREGADVFVSADFKHHQITALLSRGLSVIALTHYAAENYGFNKIYQKIIEGLNVPSAYHCESGLL